MDENNRSLDQEVEDLTDDQAFIAMQRALRSYGVAFTITPDNTIDIDDPDVYDLEALVLNNREFTEIFKEELKKMAVDKVFASLQEKGLIRPAEVNESGAIAYELTDAGRDNARSIVSD